jgi:hypothetical protein
MSGSGWNDDGRGGGKVEGQGGSAEEERTSEKVFGKLSGLWARV